MIFSWSKLFVMEIFCFSLRALNPFRGSVNTIKYLSAEAVTEEKVMPLFMLNLIDCVNLTTSALFINEKFYRSTKLLSKPLNNFAFAFS